MSISPVASSSRSQSPIDSQQTLSPELGALVEKAKAAAQVSTSLPIFIKQMERKVANANQDLNVELATLVYAAMADQTKTDFSPAISALMRQLPDKESFDAAKKHLLKYVGTDGNQAKFAKNGTLEALAKLLTQLEYQPPAAKTVEEEPEADEAPVNEPVVELEDAPQAASSSGCSRKWLIAIPVMAAAATGFYLLHKWNAEQNSCGAENPLDPSFRQLTLWDTASTFAQRGADALHATVSDWMAIPSYTGTKPSLFQTDIPNSTPVATPVQGLFESAAQTVQQWTAPVVERNFSQPVCSAAEALQQSLPTSSLTDQVVSAAEAVAATVKETVQAPAAVLQQTAQKAQEVVQVTIANLKPAAKKITFPAKFASNLHVVANRYCMAVGRICIPICNQAGELIKPVMNHLGQYIQPKAPWISCNPIKF